MSINSQDTQGEGRTRQRERHVIQRDERSQGVEGHKSGGVIRADLNGPTVPARGVWALSCRWRAAVERVGQRRGRSEL